MLRSVGVSQLKAAQWPCVVLMVAGVWAAVPLMTRAADASAPGRDTLEEVIVTAQRRAERALDVADSIGVLSAADIDRLHATNLMDLAGAVPGFVIVSGGTPGQTTVVLRGLSPFNGVNLITTLIDDSAAGGSSISAWTGDVGFDLDMLPYDVERIEILRGPQGTLYGANSMGGVLKYVMRYPSLTGSEAQLGAEGFGIEGGGSLGVGARAAWSAPLIEGTLAVRASLFDQETPGYIKNPLRGLNHENTLSQRGGRLAMLWQPTANLGVKLQAIYQGTDSAGNAIIWAEQVGTPQDPYYRPGNWLGDLTYRHFVPEPFTSDVTFISGTLEWRTAFADAVCTTSYSDKGLSGSYDWSDVIYSVQPTPPNSTVMLLRNRFAVRVKRGSQEIHLAAPTVRRLEWQAGLYYTHEKASSDVYQEALDAQLRPIPALNPWFVGYFPSTYAETTLFGTLTYRISERFDLTGGWRWWTDWQDLVSDFPASYTQPAQQHFPHAADTLRTYAFGTRFHPRPQEIVYLRVASGARPSAVNGPVSGYPEIPFRVNSDAMVSYEVGAKSELLNRKATLDLAVYRINWSHMQVAVPTADGKYLYWVNAGTVGSEGFEVAATYRPRDAIQLSANAAYTNAFATQAIPTASIFVGTRLPSSPKWTAAAMFDYRMRVLDGWIPDLSATVRYVSPQYSTLSTAPPVGLMPAYAWVDLALRITKTRYELSLYAKNLLDKRAFSYGGPKTSIMTGASAFAGSTILPRTIGLSATLTF